MRINGDLRTINGLTRFGVCKQLLLIVLVGLIYDGIAKDLPQELDPFLELLFETPECEAFISNADFLSVATTDCKPFTCDFPKQLCMRASAMYKDEKANECRNLPEKVGNKCL